MNCLETGTSYHACTMTGRSVLNESTIQCNRCHHYMIASEVENRRNCPLCHSLCEIKDSLVTIIEGREGTIPIE